MGTTGIFYHPSFSRRSYLTVGRRLADFPAALGPLLAASLLVASLAFVAGGAEAVNWCPTVTVTVSPPIYTPNVPSTYTLVVVNSGTSDLNLTGVAVRFSFETTDRVLSSSNVTVRTGTPKTFETPSITGPAGGCARYCSYFS